MSSAWKKIAIGDVVDSVKTWNPLRSLRDDSFDYVDLSAIDQDSKTIIGVRKVVCGDAPSRARQLVVKGDVLVSTVRPNLNGVALVPEELDGATASTGFCVLRPRKDFLDGTYLFHWVKSPNFISDMVKKATGANYPAVSDRIISESQIPLPPLEEQKRIAEVLDRAEEIRSKRREAIAELDTLTQAIFLEMFGDPVSNPKGWDMSKTLGDVAELVSGITKGRKLNGKAVREISYLAVVNVQDRRLDLTIIKTIEATEDEISRYKLQVNDLLLTEGGDPDKLGRGTLWNGELPECIHQNHIYRVRITSNQIHPLFLNWLIGSQRGKKYFLKQAKQTTGIATINMTQLRGFSLLIPPLDLQQEFACRVEAIEKLKAAHRASLSELDILFASLQHRAFRGEL
ncbi:restriction endonuclease subunit S [Microcoleus sp. OTE_8_concoct_300]|uniref:restriction endonuclease subunit S n=1 Tax=Microcoleus sp. OTE_8_concoct_300 TaxID=2964710 RepID=UPI00403F840C